VTDEETRSLVEEGRARRVARAAAARAARRRKRALVGVALVAVAAIAWIATHRPRAEKAAPGAPQQSVTATGAASVSATRSAGSNAATGAAGAAGSASTTSAPAAHSMTATEWADFVTEQYPGYRVQTRIDQPDQYNAGPAVNFLLINKRRPAFRLFVTFAELDPGADFEQAPEQYLDMIGRVVSTDGLFSAHAASRASYLRQEGQNAIIDAYVTKKPTADAIVFSGFGDEGEVDFAIGTGADAMSRAIRSAESYTYRGVAAIPHGPKNAQSKATIVKR